MRPWPAWNGMLAAGYGDAREQSILLTTEGGRCFTIWSHQTQIGQFNGMIDSVSIEPLRQPMPVRQLSQELRRILNCWNVEPSVDVSRVLHKMDESATVEGKYPKMNFSGYGPIVSEDGRSYWGGDECSMLLGTDTQLVIMVNPELSPSITGRYYLFLELKEFPEWYERQWKTMNPVSGSQSGSDIAIPEAPFDHALTVPLGQPPYKVTGLAAPTLRATNGAFEQYILSNPLTLNVVSSAGHSFIQRSYRTEIGVTDGTIRYIASFPSSGPQSLRQATKELEEILRRWQLAPNNGVARMLLDCKRQIPRQGTFISNDGFRSNGERIISFIGVGGPLLGYLGAERGLMLLDSKTELYVELRPISGHNDEYSVTITFALKRPGTFD